ncbi:hypothetical protein SNEBB_008211 [Seison nebaliae]|nr:hypothetical protein SNEBB_008211 [Seison nebaliae]
MEELIRTFQSIYHEKQEGRLCAQHCLNNLLQQRAVTAVQLGMIGQRLLSEMNGILNINDQEGFHDDTGFFSIEVIENCLKQYQINLIRFNSKTNELATLARQSPSQSVFQAYVCWLDAHWFTVRRFGTYWFDLNSSLRQPKYLSDVLLDVFLSQLIDDGYSVFIVDGTIPESVADINFGQFDHNVWMKEYLLYVSRINRVETETIPVASTLKVDHPIDLTTEDSTTDVELQRVIAKISIFCRYCTFHTCTKVKRINLSTNVVFDIPLEYIRCKETNDNETIPVCYTTVLKWKEISFSGNIFYSQTKIERSCTYIKKEEFKHIQSSFTTFVDTQLRYCRHDKCNFNDSVAPGKFQHIKNENFPIICFNGNPDMNISKYISCPKLCGVRLISNTLIAGCSSELSGSNNIVDFQEINCDENFCNENIYNKLKKKLNTVLSSTSPSETVPNMKLQLDIQRTSRYRYPPNVKSSTTRNFHLVTKRNSTNFYETSTTKKHIKESYEKRISPLSSTTTLPKISEKFSLINQQISNLSDIQNLVKKRNNDEKISKDKEEDLNANYKTNNSEENNRTNEVDDNSENLMTSISSTKLISSTKSNTLVTTIKLFEDKNEIQLAEYPWPPPSDRIEKSVMTREGYRCAFPFHYKNKIYHNCLDAGREGRFCQVYNQFPTTKWGRCSDEAYIVINKTIVEKGICMSPCQFYANYGSYCQIGQKMLKCKKIQNCHFPFYLYDKWNYNCVNMRQEDDEKNVLICMNKLKRLIKC